MSFKFLWICRANGKVKIKFMLENLELVKTNLCKMVELYKYVSFACRKP